jgi:hypothetical protein
MRNVVLGVSGILIATTLVPARADAQVGFGILAVQPCRERPRGRGGYRVECWRLRQFRPRRCGVQVPARRTL